MADQPEEVLTKLGQLRRNLDSASELPHIQQAMASYCASAGIEGLTYFHYAPVGALDFGPDIEVYTFGFAPAWVDAYTKGEWHRVDPISRLAAKRTLPFWWSDIQNLTRLDEGERAYMRRARDAKLGAGLGIPVFGPNGRSGYYGVGFGSTDPPTDDSAITEIHAACQLGHLRYCDVILGSLPESVTLSERERQILGHVARGHSNQLIATKLNLSAYTVDTYVRRCFEKLGVHDRVTAGLRGLALGLVA